MMYIVIQNRQLFTIKIGELPNSHYGLETGVKDRAYVLQRVKCELLLTSPMSSEGKFKHIASWRGLGDCSLDSDT